MANIKAKYAIINAWVERGLFFIFLIFSYSFSIISKHKDNTSKTQNKIVNKISEVIFLL
jgi:hypothetical protein